MQRRIGRGIMRSGTGKAETPRGASKGNSPRAIPSPLQPASSQVPLNHSPQTDVLIRGRLRALFRAQPTSQKRPAERCATRSLVVALAQPRTHAVLCIASSDGSAGRSPPISRSRHLPGARSFFEPGPLPASHRHHTHRQSAPPRFTYAYLQ